MHLIKVYSNKESFRTVEFNPSGLSFIVAKQKSPGANDDGKTYNGVGKSLLVRIIHFCLGASAGNYKDFCEKLPGWEFFLDFKVNVQNFTVKRSTGEPEKIILNSEEYSFEKYKKTMKELCFSIPENVEYLSFRTLLPFFLRGTKDAYVNCMRPGETHTDYHKLLNNAFLLGIDVKLAERKYDLRKEQERIQKLERNFREDQLLQDFFTGNRDVSLELAELDDQIKKIEEDLSKFSLAEDYYEMQHTADEIENMLVLLNNEIVIIRNNIKNIEDGLKAEHTSTMTVNDLERVYNEAKIFFPETVKKTLHDVELFYNNLVTSRVRRLSEQKNQLTFLLNDKIALQGELQKKFDENMKYLGEHQALDVFLALGQKKSDLKAKKNDLSKYQNLQSEYKTKERQTKKELLDLSEITDKYLVDIERNTKNVKEYFRALAKLFYPQSIAGLTIQTNTGDNQLAFTIDPRIESDASDGINNVKIFCYDLSILFEGKNHHVNFVFHDSRLYDGIDERQKIVMFRIIKKYFENKEKQYIATINQNQLNELRTQMKPEEYDEIVTKNTILILTDDNDSEKLLGIKVDIGNK